MLLRNNSSVSKCLGGSQNYQHPGRTQRKWRSVGFVFKRYICAFIRLVCLRKKIYMPQKGTETERKSNTQWFTGCSINSSTKFCKSCECWTEVWPSTEINRKEKFGHQKKVIFELCNIRTIKKQSLIQIGC